jgi:hypothetical protein
MSLIVASDRQPIIYVASLLLDALVEKEPLSQMKTGFSPDFPTKTTKSGLKSSLFSFSCPQIETEGLRMGCCRVLTLKDVECSQALEDVYIVFSI